MERSTGFLAAPPPSSSRLGMIAAAFLALGTSGQLLANASSTEASRFAAIAYARHSGAHGTSHGEANEFAAVRAAIADCASASCHATSSVMNGCIALAISNSDRSTFSFGTASGFVERSTLENARWAAIDRCAEVASSSPCYVVAESCSFW